MTQLKLIVNSLPRDLAEFSFFLIIGFTAGSMGLIWKHILIHSLRNQILFRKTLRII